MRRLRRISGVLSLGVLALALVAVPGEAAGRKASSGSTASAVLRDANGATIGRVGLARAGNTVVVAGRVTGLTPGFHGFHIHAVGLCEAPFTTAGGHFNPSGDTHGDHAGDLPVLLVRQDGVASAAAQTDRFTLDALFDADGSAFIVHADPDNYANIPMRYSAAGVPGPDAATLATGDSGGRTACGVITR